MSVAKNWFEEEAFFRALLDEAMLKAKTDAAIEFTTKMSQSARKFGLDTHLSSKQLSWLCRIAGKPEPATRALHTYAQEQRQMRRDRLR